ncbi:MAG: hypothetical protein ACKOX3_05020 [Bacteroidota bacterium]
MTNKEFIKGIAELYVKARQTTFPANNIRRGKSHSISSQVEDFFALYISTMVSDDTKIYIDQPISFKLNGKSKTIYADVAIIKDNKIQQVWDLKTDLGWKRDSFVQFCKDKIELVKGARNQTAKLKDGQNKAQQTLAFSNDMTFNIVVVSLTNISKSKGDLNVAGTNNLENVGVYFLTKSLHPNNYGMTPDDIAEKISYNETDFKRMTTRIKTNE